MPPARLIIDPPGDGAWNIAVDEVLLQEASRGITTLRLYQWSESTLSLGYFQAAADRAQHAASRSCPLVRRASGGGAIVHDRELTYCLAMPVADRYGREASELVNRVHAVLVAALAGQGIRAHIFAPDRRDKAYTAAQPFLCFQRLAAGDVLAGGAKIAGSAQRRQRGGLVQHGSILLAASEKAPELAGIREVTGKDLSPAEFGERFSDELSGSLNLEWAATALTAAERERASEVLRERFGAQEWTNRR